MGADNASTEEASPLQGDRGCTLSSEALPTETKPRLPKDSLAVVSRLLHNCGWISCKSASERNVCPCASASPHVCVCVAERKKEGWQREAFLSIYLHKPPIGFYSIWFFIMSCGGLYSKTAAVRGGFQGLRGVFFFGYVWECQGGEKSCVRDFVHIYLCMVLWLSVCTHTAMPMRMKNCMLNYSACIYLHLQSNTS